MKQLRSWEQKILTFGSGGDGYYIRMVEALVYARREYESSSHLAMNDDGSKPQQRRIVKQSETTNWGCHTYHDDRMG